MTNYVKTTNFLRKDSLPDASVEKVIRGSEFDTEFNNLVISSASKANLISPPLSGVPTAPTAAIGSNTTQVATTAFVTQNALLKGMIVLWSGVVANIPAGYLLCNGANGTPDLQDRFVVGAGRAYAPVAAGGSPNSALPFHTHGVRSTVSDPGHKHAIGRAFNITSYQAGAMVASPADQSTAVKDTQMASTGISVSTTIDPAGINPNNLNLPPYFALCYIMKS